MSEGSHDDQPRSEPQAVGYGRPPLHSRFKSGQSGNPKGRPRGQRNMASLLGEVLGQRITVTSNGKRKRVSSEVAMLLRLREKALGGDIRALNMLLSLRAIHLPNTEGGIDHHAMLDEDYAILVEAGLLPPKEPGHDGA